MGLSIFKNFVEEFALLYLRLLTSVFKLHRQMGIRKKYGKSSTWCRNGGYCNSMVATSSGILAKNISDLRPGAIAVESFRNNIQLLKKTTWSGWIMPCILKSIYILSHC